MNFSDEVKKENERIEKAKFAVDLLKLWFDYNNLVASRNNLIRIVRNCKVDEKFIVDSTNNILNTFYNKYGFNYECKNWKDSFTILNNACANMIRLAQNKLVDELLKDVFKMII